MKDDRGDGMKEYQGGFMVLLDVLVHVRRDP